MTDRSPDLDPPATRLSETRARGGFRDRPVLVVLAVSLLLAVLALFGLWAVQSDDMAGAKGDAGRMDRRDAENFDQTIQPPKGD
jgi:hypothetical protein